MNIHIFGSTPFIHLMSKLNVRKRCYGFCYLSQRHESRDIHYTHYTSINSAYARTYSAQPECLGYLCNYTLCSSKSKKPRSTPLLLFLCVKYASFLLSLEQSQPLNKCNLSLYLYNIHYDYCLIALLQDIYYCTLLRYKDTSLLRKLYIYLVRFGVAA